jgi:Na+-transporting NADH:ubiquinone oxidoreductase subunit A
MGLHKIRKGLNLPLKGSPSDSLISAADVKEVAVLGDDFPGLKPSMIVKEGDFVRKGEPIFSDRKNPEIIFTAPATGLVKSVNRGAKRKFLSLVIEKQDGDSVIFDTFDPSKADFKKVYGLLKSSGLLSAVRQYPFAKCPSADRKPDAVFVNCMDTRPGAPDMKILLQGREHDFEKGIQAVSKLAERTFVCVHKGMMVPDCAGLDVVQFDGKHPAGLSGTHIHFLRPVSQGKTVWSFQMQDIIDIGYLISHGELNETRRIALSGPSVKEPCHIETVKGASVADVTRGRLEDGENRIINGSILYGFNAEDEVGYLSSCFNQLSVIPEQIERVFFGWATLRNDLYSVKNIFMSKFTGEKSVEFDTALNGSKRPMVPVGTYEKVMPLDILPTHLLRSLEVGDYEMAEKLGCLELSEEDLSLCTYVCPGKIDYAPLLREALTVIEKEG